MGARTDALEQHIRSERNELGRNLRELETRVREETDWRNQFARHMKKILAVAFGFGLLFSLVIPAKRKHK